MSVTFGERFQQLRAQTEDPKKISRRLVIHLADEFNLTPKECVQRLERNGLVKPVVWDWFEENDGITNAQIMQVRWENKLK